MRALLAALVVTTACVQGGSPIPPAAEELVRPGARPNIVRAGDLDGDGIDEQVVASVAQDAAGGFSLPTPYVEVFAFRDDEWIRVFDASGVVPVGAPSGSEPILAPDDPDVAIGQAVEVLNLVDFGDDGRSEIVLAVLNAGATAGPLALWILSFADAGMRSEFATRTERGGLVDVAGQRVTLEFGVYRRGDPGCCPSAIATWVIGWREGDGEIGILSKEREKT